MLNDQIRKKLLNKALKPYNVTVDNINSNQLVNTGVKKKGNDVMDYYYNVYTFKTKESYESWRKWALELIEEEGYKRIDLDMFELVFGLKEEYIFKKQSELF